jgi:hypothetical protein
MPDNNPQRPEFDWRLTTFEGARREQLRRWACLPLEDILRALEEMEDLSRQLRTRPTGEHGASARGSSVKEPHEDIPSPPAGEGKGEGEARGQSPFGSSTGDCPPSCAAE